MKKYRKIYIEITNICNLKCSFCKETNRIKRNMTKEEFTNIVEKIKDYTDYIYLHVKGEPLLHKDIKEFLDIAYKNNIKVNLTTNGTLIKQVINSIKDCKAVNKINFSLHSENNKENYLEEIFESVKELPKSVTCIYRLWTLNNNELDEKSTTIVDKIKEYYNLSTDIVDKIKRENNIKIFNNIYVDKDNEFEWPTINDHKSNGYCYALKTQIAILVDGTVVPCCLDDDGTINLGNIHYQSLDDIINSEKYKNLQKSFQDRKPCEELCKSCRFKERLNK